MLFLDSALCVVLILGLLNGIYSRKTGKSKLKIMIHDEVETRTRCFSFAMSMTVSVGSRLSLALGRDRVSESQTGVRLARSVGMPKRERI